MRFAAELIIFNALLLVSTLPVASINKQLRRFQRPRKWYIAAVVSATIAAIVGWSSRILVRDCLSEINDGCVDIGGQGLQFIIIAGFICFALASYKMTKDS